MDDTATRQHSRREAAHQPNLLLQRAAGLARCSGHAAPATRASVVGGLLPTFLGPQPVDPSTWSCTGWS